MSLFDSRVVCEFVKHEPKSILRVSPKADLNVFDWITENKQMLEDCLIKFGGVLLRGFGIYSLSEFNRAVQILSPSLLDYVYRSTPRTKLGGKVYTATEYPANKKIPMHNENSYSRSWPDKIFFFSVVVAASGGETPLADSRRVYQKIDKSVRSKFEAKGVCYVRNYHSGIDLSWQEVFQTTEKEVVNQYCRNNGIEYEWSKGGSELVTRQTCKASIRHPSSKEVVWFNQAHLFHVSALDEKESALLFRELGKENIPRNSFYGDGEPIEAEVLDHIRDIYDNEKIKFLWERGDLLLLDNVLTAHGRESYTGERKVAVAMS